MRDSGVVRVDGVLISGWLASAVSTLVERHLHAAPVGDRRLVELLTELRAYVQAGCAAQPAQPPDDDDTPWWPQDDEINVREAATLMGCSRTNVRKRAGKSLSAIKVGDRWVLSRTAVIADIARRCAR